MSDLATAQAAYEAVWEDSHYTNILSMRYILDKAFPETECAWTEYFRRCEVLLKEVKEHERWDKAGKQLGKKTGKVLGDNKPEWDEKIPEHLWATGTGQCTSFAIATNIKSGIKATYVEYPAAHRLAKKPNSTKNSVIVIDSGHLLAFQIAEGERIAKWQNRLGKILYKTNGKMVEPVDVEDHQEAMKLCLDQLFRKGRYPLLLQRGPVDNHQGTWGRTIIFSPFHRAFKLQEPNSNGFCVSQYIIFGMGSEEDKVTCYKTLYKRTRFTWQGDVGKILFQEVLEIFQKALIH